MSLITLANGPLRCSIAPDLGGGIADFSVQGPAKFYYPIMRRAAPAESNSSSLGSFFMAPWCNRIADARFTFGGTEHILRPNSAAHGAPAQHGDVRARPFKLMAREEHSLRLRFDSADHQNVNWPWRFACEAAYFLSQESLRIELSVINMADRPFPAGCGHHPYFSRRLWDDRDQIEVRCPVKARYDLLEGVPTGPAHPEALCHRLESPATFPDEHIDTVFSGFDGSSGAELRWPESGTSVRITASAEMGHLVLYAPHSNGRSGTPLAFVAVEPQSQVNGALNRPEWGDGVTGTRVLDPGKRLDTWTEFVVRTP